MILIALGANLPSRFGPPAATLELACEAMESHGLRILARSSIWLTAPVPVSEQPWYHNAVVRISTELSPYALMEALQQIEASFGRLRSIRNAPRVLDLDLVAYDDAILNKPELIVPHPRMHQRSFVLLPLQEIAPEWEHPILQQSVSRLVEKLPPDGSRKLTVASETVRQ